MACNNPIQSVEEYLGPGFDEETEEINIDEVLKGSKLPVCVIQRVLLGHKRVEPEADGWLHGKIFHTRVKY